MCGRFTRKYTWREVWEFHEGRSYRGPEEDPTPNYNVPPTASVPVIRFDEDGPIACYMQWWLIPSWSKTPEVKYNTFNAKSEEAATKASFCTPFRRRRCVIPASGFYEWQKKGAGGRKRPHYITRADEKPLYFAGLWDRWVDQANDLTIVSCTVLTTKPNAEMQSIHDRMPCILEPEQIAAWCDPKLTDVERIQAFLRPAADGLLVMHEVSPRVGDAKKHNDLSLIKAV